ncbi:transglycosylase domain-containing protein [Streptomyces sp. 6N223]|uniref:transglycosylase domain-containing protein n=1 Tax=Streptomyces sp. 6N223 TaxID=3457412 RepID=UPI003FD2716C
MSEHRRKPPQSRGRRAAPPSGRRAANPGPQPQGRPSGPPTPPPPPGATPERPYGSRAEARRAAQRGGRRRAAGSAAEGVGGGRRRRAAPPRRKRFIDYPRSGYTGLRRWMPSWKQVLGSTLTFIGMLIGLVGVAYAMIEIPEENELTLAQSNTYYWADGTQMVTSGGVDGLTRQNVELTDIPKACQDAVVAAENATFWEDAGIDPIGIGRAVLNMARGGDVQSGSTITQQYVKNTYLSQEQTLTRKARELLLSIKVGAEYSKDEILEGYFNTSYFGRGQTYGIQAAAQAYYGKNASELNTSECAYMATLLNGANLYDPFISGGEEPDPEIKANAEARWSWVLNRMVEVGDMRESDRAQYTKFPLPNPQTPSQEKAGQIGYLTMLADNYLTSNDIVSEEELTRGGYQIHTTFDRDLVNAMQGAVEGVMEENIDPEARPEDRHVQFGGASVVPGDGAIVAIYGGKNFLEHYVNNADRPDVQVGSTFKPFVIAAAMRDGVRDPEKGEDQGTNDRTRVSLDSMYPGEDELLIENYDGTTWEGEDPETKEPFNWEQNNFEGGSYEEISLWEAMEVSANSPLVQLGMDVGPNTVAQAAIDAGLKEESLGPHDDTVPTFALGVSTPSAIRMASAYSTFAAHGEQAEPYSVEKVEKRDPAFYWAHDDDEELSETEQAFDSDVADNVTEALVGVVENGSGSGAQELGIPSAGKTGTTDDNRSAWYVGYTPNLSTAIGMWRQADSEEDLVEGEKMGFLSMYGTAGEERINGGSLPLDVWVDYMKVATRGDEAERFPDAPNVGETIYAHGVDDPQEDLPVEEDPLPTQPEESESPEESEEPDPSPTDSTPTDDPTSPDPTETCWWDCETGGTDTGGTDTGGTDEGTDSGTSTGTDSGTTEGGETSGTEGGGDNGGGFIIGGQGATEEETP